MPRDGGGVYSLPAGYLATTGNTIQATQHNPPLEDLESDMNDARPIVAGGTGATSASAARTSLGIAIGSDVQAWDAGLDDIAGLALTNGNIIVGDGSNWVAESGGTARTSLGVAIGSDVQAWSADLDTYSSNPLTAAELGELQNIGATTISATQWSDLGSMSTFGASLIDDANASAAQTTLGLGTIATQASTNVNIDGGSIDGTAIGASAAAAGTFSTLTTGSTTTFNGDTTVDAEFKARDSETITDLSFTTPYFQAFNFDPSTVSNAPSGMGTSGEGGGLQLRAVNSSNGLAFARNLNSAEELYTRALRAGTWEAWRQVLAFAEGGGAIDASDAGSMTLGGALTISGATSGITLTDTTNNTDSILNTTDNGSVQIGADENDEAASSTIQFRIDGSEVGRFDSAGLQAYDGLEAGTIDLGSTTNDGWIANGSDGQVDQQVAASTGDSAQVYEYYRGTTVECQIRGDGDLENTNNAYGAISDIRFKKNVSPARSQLADIRSVELINYELADDIATEHNRGKEYLGVSAQQLEQVGIGGVVRTSPATPATEREPARPERKSIAYSLLYLKNIKATQELADLIDGLMARIETLETA